MAMAIVEDVIAPKEIILPTQETLTNPSTGQLCISGSKLFCYSGSAWIELSGVNTGD